MKEIKINLLILVIFGFIFRYCFAHQDTNNNTKKKSNSFCGTDYAKYNVTYMKIPEKKKVTLRKLDSDDFQPIRIFADIKNLYVACDTFGICDYEVIKGATDKVVETIKKLIKVKPLQTNIIVNKAHLGGWSNIDDKLTGEGVEADLVVLLGYSSKITSSFDAISEQKEIEPDTKRPTVGTITLTLQLLTSLDKWNVQYLSKLLLHQFTHILGFLYQSFENFPNLPISQIVTFVPKDERSDVYRQYIITPTVVAKAKEYYGCDDLIGVELEDQDSILPGSHWEARTLLGEYMNGFIYTEEQVISEFTLALLEDSGWYKVNYYTGGLMRFGKHKGCEFLNQDCITKSGKENYFKNEFGNEPKDTAAIPGCTSGRQSRAYITYEQFSSFNPEKYADRFQNDYGGIEQADYCLGYSAKQQDEKEGDENDFYVGNCKLSTTKNYGTLISFGSGYKGNKKLPLEFGEVIGNNSICVLSSLYPNNKTNEGEDLYASFDGIVHPMCYPIFCSEKSLTIQIRDQYIVCPRTGGRVEIGGDYKGSLYCPDYNLICTGTVVCNDIFDCVEKESLPKLPIYDYKIKTSQIIDDLIIDPILTDGQELATDGICPQNCNQCTANKKCHKCYQGYNLIGEKEDDDKPIICDNKTNINVRYYKINDIYYPCTENCLTCNKTHCSLCDNIYKLDEDKIKCIDKVEHCQEYDSSFNCKKCKGDYVFLREDRTVCYIIDKTKHYTKDNGTSYYPCDNSVFSCDECTDQFECTKCLTDWYFIQKDRTKCYNDKDLDKYFTLDGGLSYYPCDTNISNCDVCENKPNICKTCKTNYYFYKYDRKSCINNLTLTDYYTTDNKVSYFPCNEAIDYCKECNNVSLCERCEEKYAFIEEDRYNCKNIPNKKKYYTNDKGISYYPCNTHFPYCDECSSQDECTRCIEGYGFLLQDRTTCIEIDKKKYYSDDGGVSFIPCSDALINCDECENKLTCNKCKSGYYFLQNDRRTCRNDLNLSQYFTEDNGESYYPCSTDIKYCDTCLNRTICSQCQEGYYFLEYNRVKCFNNITNKNQFYTTDSGVSFFSCRSAMKNCDECANSYYCEKCLRNFYITYEKNDECLSLDIKKYYTEEDDSRVYYPCNYEVDDCDECYSKYYCHICRSGFAVVIGFPDECLLKSDLATNQQYFQLNNTHFKKCSDSILNCLYCTSGNSCIKCEEEFYFLNENRGTCTHKTEFLPEDEYFQVNETDYYSCGYKKVVANCKKCTGKEVCKVCLDGYALISNSSAMCYVKSSLKIGYYTDDEIVYHPCIEKCDKCTNSYECEKCSSGNILLAENTLCDKCRVDIIEKTDDLEPLINDLGNKYLKDTENINSLVIHYANREKNQSITLFKTWECTSDLLAKGYFKIDLKELNSQLSQKFSLMKKYYLFYEFVTNNNKNYLKIHNTNTSSKDEIDIESKCPDCETYEITNNFTYDITQRLGNKVCTEVMKKDIDVFEIESKYFKDVCSSFNLEKIDIPLSDRNFIYLGNQKGAILCTDENCEINTKDLINFTSTCSCKINFYRDHLIEQTDTNKNNYIIRSISNPLSLYKCIGEGVKTLGRNIGFYVGLAIIVIQIILFIVFVSQLLKSKGKKPSNPPPFYNIKNDYKRSKNILYVENIDNLLGVNISSTPSVNDPPKEIQDMDEGELVEEEIEDSENVSDRTGGNYDTSEIITEKCKKELGKRGNLKEKNKLPLNDEESEEGDDELDITPKEKKKKKKKTRNKIKGLTSSDSSSVDSKEEIKVIQAQFEEENKKKEKSEFCSYYWYIVGLKHPIISLFSSPKSLTIPQSFVPNTIRGIEIFFMLGLCIFINQLFLTQKYFSKKFRYFDNKYQIRFEGSEGLIASGELISYSISNNILGIIICLVICALIQELVNYILLSTRRKINKILNIHAETPIDLGKEIGKAVLASKKSFVIFFSINIVLMIAFLVYSICFIGVYQGGSIDFLGPALASFVLLLIAPFIYCLVITIVSSLCCKKSEDKSKDKDKLRRTNVAF